MFFRASLTTLLIAVGCVATDDGSNPPPARSVVSSGPMAPVTGPKAEVRADPSRIERAGQTRAIVAHLEDTLAGVDTPTVDGPVVAPTIRAYRNPWAYGATSRFRYRLNWTAGTRNRWNMRAALALPAPATARWSLTIPAAASLVFDYAAGARTPGTGPLTTRVTIDGEPVWIETRPTTPMSELAAWDPVRVDLTAWEGRTVALEVQVEGRPRDVALLAEAVITTLDPAAAKTTTGLEAADNVIIVISDAQRDDTIAPGRHRVALKRLFPIMEGLVDSGASFREARSVGNQTRLSTFALLSSQYPRYGRFHSVPWDLSEQFKRRYYDGDPPLMPRVLRRLGYRTISIGNNAFHFGNQDISLDSGWDAVVDFRNSVMDTPWMTDGAIDWLERHRDQRFAMVINYNAPHGPYVPPDDMWLPFRPQLQGVNTHNWGYLGEIKYVDLHLARVLAALERLRLRSRTLVVLTADHGEVMDGRHGCWNRVFEYPCLHTHGNTLFDEEVRVPLVFNQPGRVPPGRVIDAPISHIDLLPTILGLLGIEKTRAMLGRDFSAAIRGGDPPRSAPAMMESRLATAIVDRGLKYILHEPGDDLDFARDTLWNPKTGREELYDLGVDPDELTNRIFDPEYARRVTHMRKTLRTLQDGLAARRPAWSAVRLHAPAGGTFAGRITTTGRFLGVEGATKDGAQALKVGETAQIRFYTAPPDAPLTFELRLDDAPIEADRLYIGAWGLELVSEPVVTDFSLAISPKSGPPVSSTTPPGVFFWREHTGTRRAVDGGGMDSSVQRMMKDWGYQ